MFTILISNTDDHLRNHGFLHQRGGELFRLDDRQAHEVLDEVVRCVGSWRRIAARHGLAPSEIARMEPAFAAAVP